MRLADAPQPGWYPDPEGGSRLRWWDGADWIDRYRSKPVDKSFLVDDEVRAKLERQKQREERIAAAGGALPESAQEAAQQAAQYAAQRAAGAGAQQYGQQAQQYAEEQWKLQQQRASEWARHQSQQARNIAQQMTPLVAEQAQNFGKYLKRIFWIVVVLVVAYWFLRLLATGVITDLIKELQEDQSGLGVSAGVALWGRYRVDL